MIGLCHAGDRTRFNARRRRSQPLTVAPDRKAHHPAHVHPNLFQHYALDPWLATNHPDVPFCRSADDGILPCRSEAEADQMREHLNARLREVGLVLHPQKTRVVYCKDGDRTGRHENVQFDFLGYTFRPRQARSRSGNVFTGFTPAISRSSLKSIRQTVRSWRWNRRSAESLEDLARFSSPAIRGWIGYYGLPRDGLGPLVAMHCGAVR